jgi:anti-sigma factor RsiW
MTCREFAQFLDSYLAGELSPEEVAEFQRHLAVCDHCVAYLDGYQKTVDAVRRLRDSEADVPETVPEELVQAILLAKRAAGP